MAQSIFRNSFKHQVAVVKPRYTHPAKCVPTHQTVGVKQMHQHVPAPLTSRASSSVVEPTGRQVVLEVVSSSTVHDVVNVRLTCYV